MFRALWIIGVFLVVCVLMPVSGIAAEHGGQEHGGQTGAPAAPPAEQEEQAPAPVAPEPVQAAPPALKPILITFTGDLASVDAKSSPAMITLKDRYGVTKEISCSADSKVTQGGAAKTLMDLKTGDKLTVEYTYDVATGKRTAQSITVGEMAKETPGT